MSHFYWFVLSLSLFLTVSAFCAENQNDQSPTIPASLEDAKTAEETEAYIEHVSSQLRKNIKTEDDEIQFIREFFPIAIKAADKIIALAKDDKMLETAYRNKLQALNASLLVTPENEESKNALNVLIEEITKTGKFSELLLSEQIAIFFRKIHKLDTKTLSQEKFDLLKEEAKKLFLAEQKHYYPFKLLTIVLDFAKQIETEQNKAGFLDTILKELVQFVQSETAVKRYGEDKPRDDGRLTRVEKLQGYCRRMVGSPFELQGKTTEGNDFSWDDYKGKVVLIEFTASWCGPCRAEMPNLLEIYSKYRNKGFEIISIGIWDSTENLKKQKEEDKIPWTVISEELSLKEDNNLAGKRYGVDGVPTIFLVGTDGKIISSELRGTELYSAVNKLFEDQSNKNTNNKIDN
ncbi:MAG: TlpA family protein disulfide reductase [Planctomycetaceae bacterium]|jgi:thiol-disulfide isomerase/thioredoxin|nr:TlpA family protein disulfide reductase [Planctomycetaceae bacterium]